MTQALLNNLNNMTEGVYATTTPLVSADAENDFDNILDNKTLLSDAAADDGTNCESDNAVTLGDLKTSIKDNTELISTIIKTVVQEAEAEAAVDINLVEEDIADSEPQDTEQEESITTEDDNITDEDPTLHKEQITLENPNAALLLQSQISIVKKNSNDSEQTEQTEDSPIVFKKTGAENSIANTKNQTVLSEKSVKYADYTKKDDANVKSDKSAIDQETVKALNIESIESGSADNNSSRDLMQNQTPQEQVVKAMIRGDVNFETINVTSQANVQKADISTINPSRIVEQITKQLENMYNGSRVNIVLNPENLGKVALNIINTKDGLSAQFTVTTQEARDILMKGLSGLRDGLIAQGVSVDNVTVKLSESGDGEHHFDWTEQEGSNGGNKGQGYKRQKEQEKNFEQMMFEMNENGNV